MWAETLCLGHHFQNLYVYVRVMMFLCVPFCEHTRCNTPWGVFISVESSSQNAISILNASYSLFGCVPRKAMVRYLNYYRMFINARQCFIIAFLRRAHAQVNRLPIAESWLYYLLGVTIPIFVLFGDFNLSFLEEFKIDFKIFLFK